MKDIQGLDQLGKQVSDGYVHEGVSLNEGLNKVATESSLNREQIQRVAEVANTETYLSLMKTAKENYVNFDLADFKQVHGDLSKVASDPLDTVDDYDLDYEEVVGKPDVVDTNKNLEKTASIEKTASEAKLDAIKARETMKYLDEAAYESIVNMDTDYLSLEKIAKQIILSDSPFGNVKEIIKVASEYIAEPAIELLEGRLAKYAPHIDLTKEAQINGLPNTDSELYKAAEDLQAQVIRYLKIENAIDHYNDKYTSLVDDYDLPLVKEGGDIGRIVYHTTRLVGRTAKSLVRGAKKFPTLATGAVLYTIGRKTGKSKGKREQGKVLSRRSQYRKRKPTVLTTYRGK